MKKLCAVLFIVVGILAIILAFSAYDLDVGSKEPHRSYGGDAYTGIQNAAAETANNVHYLAEAVSFSAGSILLISGLALIIYGLRGIFDKDQPAYSAPIPMQACTHPNTNLSADKVVPHPNTNSSTDKVAPHPTKPVVVLEHTNQQNEKPTREYGENEFRPGKTYYRNDEIIFEGKHYVCIIDEHKSTVWNPKLKASDWAEI